MNQKYIKLILLSGLATGLLGVSGCPNNYNAKSTVEAAGVAVSQGDLAGFSQLLSGNARERYASLVGIAKLQSLLRGTTPKVSRANLLGNFECKTDCSNFYSVDVLNESNAVILNTTVVCRVHETNGHKQLGPAPIVTYCSISEITY